MLNSAQSSADTRLASNSTTGVGFTGMPDRQVPDTVIGPPRPSGADFFLPRRGAKSLDAARVRIVRIGSRQGGGSSSGTGGGQNPAGGSSSQE